MERVCVNLNKYGLETCNRVLNEFKGQTTVTITPWLSLLSVRNGDYKESHDTAESILPNLKPYACTIIFGQSLMGTYSYASANNNFTIYFCTVFYIDICIF